MEGDFINFGLKPEKKTLKFKVLEFLLALNYWWTLLFHKFVRSQERKIAEKFQTPAQKRTFYEHVSVELLVVLFDHTPQYMNGKLRRYIISRLQCVSESKCLQYLACTIVQESRAIVLLLSISFFQVLHEKQKKNLWQIDL